MKTSKNSHSSVIDEDTLNLLNETVVPVQLSAQKKQSLLDDIWDKVDNDSVEPAEDELLITVKKDEGEWKTIAPRVKKKVLYTDTEKNIEAYLLRFLPGGIVPKHFHNADELCMVLEGSVSFADIQLSAGDFHVAKEGSLHGISSTKTGALLYLQSRLDKPYQLSL